jgi:hypothetical protein
VIARPTLSVHPQAASRFDVQAQELVLRLRPGESTKISPSAVRPDAHVDKTLSEADIFVESIVKGQVDFAGRETAKLFYNQRDGWVGLAGEAFISFVELGESMQRSPELSPYLSRSFVEDALFGWIRKRYLAETDSRATEYVIRNGRDAISSLEVWIPVPTLSTTLPFSVGKATIKPMARELFDQWEARAASSNVDRKYFDHLRRNFQGLAAATLCVVAERTRAGEIALEEAEKSLAGLRIFSRDILHPYGRSYWEPQSFLDPAAFDLFFTQAEDSGSLLGRHSAMLNDRADNVTFTQEMVIEAFRGGLDKVHDLLLNDQPSPFQRECLAALLQYSRSALKRDPSEKVLYIISALESIFASGAVEGGIGRSLEERLAIFIRSDLKERIDLTKTIRRVYGLRSAFVHRSLPVKDLKLVEGFMMDAMAAFRKLLLASLAYNDKDQFIGDLDHHRFMGPTFQPLGR